jgi:regulator-associated protein of mTOR
VKPTANGELWVFNKTFTQYMPISIHDLAVWLGSPVIYVLVCSCFLAERRQDCFAETHKCVQTERVLFHYNGHGVPQPTENGELWVFNKTFTQYIPISIHDLAVWLGSPVIYVFDCSHAGLIVDALKAPPEPMHGTYRSDTSGLRLPGANIPPGGAQPHLARPLVGANDPAHETIVLAACGSNQLLPQDSDLCADIFTACLTTPIKVAMRWCETASIAAILLGADLQSSRWLTCIT